MRETLLTAVAATIVLVSGAFAHRAEAVTLSGQDIAAARPAFVEQVANVCGANGCAPVQMKRVQNKKKPGGVVVGKHI